MNTQQNSQSKEHSIMPSTCFRFFVRKNYPKVEISNEALDALCIEFNKYLNELNLTPEVRKRISPKNEWEIIMNMHNPIKENGFHPALIIYFDNFVTKLTKKYI